MRLVLLLCFGLVPLIGYSQLRKGKLFIIGGGSRPDAMVIRLIHESSLDKGGYAVILPMSSATPDSSVFYATEPFTKQGVHAVKGLNFVKGEALKKTRLDSIRNAKLVYITGGDQNRFMDVVRGTAIETAIREAYEKGAVISGTSAGAAVMSKLMITGNELKHKEYQSTFETIEAGNIEITDGLGLIQGVIIDQHFLVRSRHNRLISAVIEHAENTGIGIDESTAILVSDNEIEVIGESQVVVIRNPNKSRVVRNGKLSASGLTMTLYLAGDKFNIR